MKNQNGAVGVGESIPPKKEHVIIYFLEKGKSAEDAQQFFDAYSKREWRNRCGQLIHNWKEHAWNMIYYQK